jgi:hypothetical protein
MKRTFKFSFSEREPDIFSIIVVTLLVVLLFPIGIILLFFMVGAGTQRTYDEEEL